MNLLKEYEIIPFVKVKFVSIKKLLICKGEINTINISGKSKVFLSIVKSVICPLHKLQDLSLFASLSG